MDTKKMIVFLETLAAFLVWLSAGCTVNFDPSKVPTWLAGGQTAESSNSPAVAMTGREAFSSERFACGGQAISEAIEKAFFPIPSTMRIETKTMPWTSRACNIHQAGRVVISYDPKESEPECRSYQVFTDKTLIAKGIVCETSGGLAFYPYKNALTKAN